MKNPAFPMPQNKPFDVDLDALLHPAQAFEHPRDVIGDADLTLNEKRAILASWASDACAVEAAPGPAASDREIPIPPHDGPGRHGLRSLALSQASKTWTAGRPSATGRCEPMRRR